MKNLLRSALIESPTLLRLASQARGHRLHKPEIDVPYVEVKKGDGNWAIPTRLVGPASVIYSFGIGYDYDFEAQLIRDFGATVHAFDPAPMAIQWMSELDLPAAYKFHPYGLSATGETLTFTDVRDRSLTSNLAGYDGPLINLQTKRLGAIMEELGHDHVDVMKMDIEGAEYAVLADMIAGGILPKVLMVEFHHKMYHVDPQATRKAIKDLRQVGYRIYWVSDYGREYALVRHH